MFSWYEVPYLAVEERNQEKLPTLKDHVIEKRDVIGLTSLRLDPEMQNFNVAFHAFVLTNSDTRIQRATSEILSPWKTRQKKLKRIQWMTVAIFFLADSNDDYGFYIIYISEMT